MKTWLAAPCLLLAACGGGAAAGTLATRADSAGVEIVTNPQPVASPDDTRFLDPVPMVEIGPRPDDDPRYDLLRVTSGRLLPDGSSVVTVAGHYEVRLYDAQGAWLRTLGRQGDGPGEFRAPGTLTLAGDTLFIVDFQLSRASAFSLDGGFLASWPYPTTIEGARIALNTRLPDGRWLGTGVASFTAGQVAAGVSRIPSNWYLTSADLSRVEGPVTSLAGTERVVRTTTGAGGTITSMEVTTLPAGRSSAGAATLDGLVAGDTERAELRLHAPDGTLRRILRWAADPVPLDGALWERLKQADLARTDGSEEARARVERRFETMPAHTTLPVFSGISPAPGGGIWVREFAPLQTDSVRFQVFDGTGQWLGTATLPPRTTVLDIGPDRLLALWQDDDDLEYLRLYRLRR